MHCVYLLTCGLFNDTGSKSGHTCSNYCRIISRNIIYADTSISQKEFLYRHKFIIWIYIFSLLYVFTEYVQQEQRWIFFRKSFSQIQVKSTPKSSGNLKDTLLFVTKSLQIWYVAYSWWSCEEALTQLLIFWKLNAETFLNTCNSDSRLCVNTRHSRDM